MRKLAALILFVPVILVFVSPLGEASPQTGKSYLDAKILRQIPEDSRVVAVKVGVVQGRQLTFVKFENKEGVLGQKVFDRDYKPLTTRVPKPPRRVVGKQLQAVLAEDLDPETRIRVNIALQVDAIEVDEEPVTGTVEIVGTAEEFDLRKMRPKFTLNDRDVSEKKVVASAEKQRKVAMSMREERRGRSRSRLRELASRLKMVDDPDVQLALKHGRDTVSGVELTREQLHALIKEGGELIAGVDLYVKPKDQVAGAMLSTRVDPWAIDYSARRGDGIGIYMTESGCAPDSFMTNYDRLAGSNTSHSRNVSSIMRAVSPDSYIYCRGGAVLPTAADLNGYGGNPPIHIVNRSNGGGDNDDYTTSDRDWDNLVYDEAVATFISAGNYGDDNGYIMSPSKGFNVVSVGAYDDSTDVIADFSSYKDPETGADKPELSAPGVSIAAGGYTKSGTSMSSPHAAAFAADLMGRYTWLKWRPYLVKSLMMSGAWKSITGGRYKVGLGGVDFYRSYYSFHYHWWQGGNGSFSFFDNNDPLPGNNFIDSKWVNLSSSLSKVRITLVWLNRGAYTYSHRNDAHPIGMDLDMRVYDPNGNYVAGSYSWDNPYEWVEFDPAVTGVYRVAINRYANRDTSSKLHMGLLYQR